MAYSAYYGTYATYGTQIVLPPVPTLNYYFVRPIERGSYLQMYPRGFFSEGDLMNKLLIMTLFASQLLAGCLTYRWEASVPENLLVAKSNDSSAPKFAKIEGVKDPTRRNHFQVTNESKKMISVSFKQSVIEIDGKSYRVLSGSTINMNRDRESPDTPIAPNTVAEVSFYPEDGIAKSIVINGTSEITYRIALRQDEGKPEYAILRQSKAVGGEFTTKVNDRDKWGCIITGIFYGGWCWFVKPNDEDRKQAEERGKDLYGPNAKISFVKKE